MGAFSTGSGYTRFPDVEAEIEEMSKCSRSDWRRRAKQLHNETLVCLVRKIGRDDGETAGPLLMELGKRTVRIAT